MSAPRPPHDSGTRVGVVVLGRDRRLWAQIAAIAAVGLLVVLGGLGLGGPAETADEARPSATPRPGGSASPSRAGPTATAATACATVPTDDPPFVRLRSSSGDQSPVRDTPGATPGVTPSDEPSETLAPVAWTVPGLERGVLLPSGSSLILDALESACIRSVEIIVAPADATDPGSEAGEARLVRPARPAEDVDVGSLPPGDWVVRVAVEFVGTGPDVAALQRVAFFRVVAGDVPVLAPSPQVTPAVGCGPDPLGRASPRLVLVIDDGTPIAAQDDIDAKPLDVRLGQAIEVRAVGDVCARGWSIEVADGRGNAFLQESYPNPVDNPFLAAQNRWALTQLLAGDSTITATVRFGRDREFSGTWRLRLETPALPAAQATGPDGPPVAALPGCGEYWALPDVTAFEPCAVQTVPDDLETLRLRAGDVVRVDVEGWTISSWFARCGEAIAVGAAPAEFVTLDDCDLGQRASPAAIAFVPWPGDRLVLIGITAERDGMSGYGNYYIRVEATP